MEYPYNIEDLATQSGVTTSSAYAFIKKNQAFVKENSIRIHRKVKYNQAVLKLFLDYYRGGEAASSTEGIEKSNQNEATESLPEGSESPSEPLNSTPSRNTEEELERLREAVESLKEQLNETQATLKKVDAERGELLKQNGLALMMLQQEKQEKLLIQQEKKLLEQERDKLLQAPQPIPVNEQQPERLNEIQHTVEEKEQETPPNKKDDACQAEVNDAHQPEQRKRSFLGWLFGRK